MANSNVNCLFAKADIQDRFWRVFVEPIGQWNFAYTLPKRTLDEPIYLVVPNSTQIGWVKGIYIFYLASETARDVGQQLLE